MHVVVQPNEPSQIKCKVCVHFLIPVQTLYIIQPMAMWRPIYLEVTMNHVKGEQIMNIQFCVKVP